jgi:hypothetical protein
MLTVLFLTRFVVLYVKKKKMGGAASSRPAYASAKRMI